MSDSKKELLLSLLNMDNESSSDDKKELLIKLINTSEEESISTPEDLKKCYKIFTTKHDFQEGDLVQWKPHMHNRKRPKRNETAVVMKVYEKPIHDKQQDSSTHVFREQYDIILGIIDSAGDLVAFHYDSRRFEPYAEE